MTTPSDSGNTTMADLGGPKTINLIVGALYFHITNDPRIAHFFRDTPVDRIMAHQRAFLTQALTGENVYCGRALSEAHADLIARHGLTETHFDIVLEHLRQTLSELEIDARAATEVERRIAATRSTIFGPK